MNRLALAFACALVASADAQEPAAAPTAFEALATARGSETRLERTVGTLASSDASARIVVLVLVTEGAAGSETIRGVRFDLTNNGGMDQVYLDVAQLTKLRNELHGIARGFEAMSRYIDAPYRTQGTADCWLPPQPARILCPEYYIQPDGLGLALGAYSGPRFMFPDRTPTELIELIDSSLTVLGEEGAQR